MNITKITTEANVNYDQFLVETLVKPSDTNKVKSNYKNNIDNWSAEILKEGLSKLENNIQSSVDTSPLSYDKAPIVETLQDAQKVLSDINIDYLVKNINNIFDRLDNERISNLFLEGADIVV